MTGRGRGESKHILKIDQGDELIERDRQAQVDAARALGMSESDIPIRGRGGFRQQELRTIPSNATNLSNSNIQGARQVDVLANYVQIKPMPNRVVYMYRIDYEPQVEANSTRRFLFKTAAGKLFKKAPIYDGMHECRVAEQLDQQSKSVTISEKADYKVTFTNTGTVAFGQESLRLYNMHMKEFLRAMDFYQPQTGIYVHPNMTTQINADVMMMRGFRTSANTHDLGKTLMNLEAAHKLMQKSNVLSIMGAIKARPGLRDLAATLNSELVGKLVVTSYDKRAYRIEDVKVTMNPSMTFDCRGENISYIEYYRRKNVEIRSATQPLLLVVPNNMRRREEVTRETYLIPELCNLAGLTEEQRNDGQLKFNLIKASQVNPNTRVQHMQEFLEKFHSNQQVRNVLADWGYAYEKEAVKLKAFVIAPTKIAIGPKTREPTANWMAANPQTADIRVDALAVVPSITKLVFITPNTLSNFKGAIMNAIKGGFDQVGMRVAQVNQVNIDNPSPNNYSNSIGKIESDVDVAIVVMPSQNKPAYDAIKKAASVHKGLITQVVTSKLMTDQRKARSAASKIAIQIAAKVGGEPWWADIPLKAAMICGYDTYHDTTQRGRSFGAFLASMNMHYSRWWSKADMHDKLEEISAQVSANMVEAVQQYRKCNANSFPERVIIYRDGVGEGQLEHVYKVELCRISDALKSVGSPKPIQLTMVIVSKRIGARFYMRSNEGFSNPPPGTIIDHTVTRQERYDFYLVSQSTRQGSITPTYYNIIHDENGFPPEIHQKLAYKLCLLYYNWSGTVRVPAPCQYAHKLAFLCGEHLHAQPSANMDDKLHFL